MRGRQGNQPPGTRPARLTEDNHPPPAALRRLHMIHCACARAEHPMTRFRCGSLKTLLEEPKDRGVDVRDR